MGNASIEQSQRMQQRFDEEKFFEGMRSSLGWLHDNAPRTADDKEGLIGFTKALDGVRSDIAKIDAFKEFKIEAGALSKLKAEYNALVQSHTCFAVSVAVQATRTNFRPMVQILPYGSPAVATGGEQPNAVDRQLDMLCNRINQVVVPLERRIASARENHKVLCEMNSALMEMSDDVARVVPHDIVVREATSRRGAVGTDINRLGTRYWSLVDHVRECIEKIEQQEEDRLFRDLMRDIFERKRN